MDLDDIRALVEVANSGGFTKAARRLRVAKSVVSRRIARIEAELGTRLIHRTTRGVGPTDAGRELVERGKRILSEVAEARAAVAAREEGMAGSLRIALPLSFGIRRMAPILASLHATHREIEIDASYSDAAVDLIAGRFDAAVRIGYPKSSSLVARHIAPVALILVASPDYVARNGAPAVPADLAHHECLVHSGAAERQAWRFKGGPTIAPHGRLHFDDGEAMLRAAEAGLGIAALPDFLIEDSIKSGRLVPILKDHPLPEGTLYVLRPPGGPANPRVRALTELMVQRFGRRRAR